MSDHAAAPCKDGIEHIWSEPNASGVRQCLWCQSFTTATTCVEARRRPLAPPPADDAPAGTDALIARLREAYKEHADSCANDTPGTGPLECRMCELCDDAADRIEALVARIAYLDPELKTANEDCRRQYDANNDLLDKNMAVEARLRLADEENARLVRIINAMESTYRSGK